MHEATEFPARTEMDASAITPDPACETEAEVRPLPEYPFEATGSSLNEFPPSGVIRTTVSRHGLLQQTLCSSQRLKRGSQISNWPCLKSAGNAHSIRR